MQIVGTTPTSVVCWLILYTVLILTKFNT